MKKKLLMAAALGLGLFAVAPAAEAAPRRAVARADLNRDGRVGPIEYGVRARQEFLAFARRIDLNRDGLLSRFERRRAHRVMRGSVWLSAIPVRGVRPIAIGTLWQRARPAVMARFRRLDRSGDGRLAPWELRGRRAPLAARHVPLAQRPIAGPASRPLPPRVRRARPKWHGPVARAAAPRRGHDDRGCRDRDRGERRGRR